MPEFKKTLIFISIAVWLFSCKTQNVVNYTAVEKLSINRFIKTLKKQKPLFKQVKVKSKIKFALKKKIPSLNANLYIENEEKIWANISKFGINGARVLIEPGRFRLYSRLEKQYIDGDFSYLNNLLNVDFIDYSKLQNLLLGRNFANLNAKKYQLKIEGNLYFIAANKNELISSDQKSNDFTEEYWFNPNFTLNKVNFYYPKKNTTIKIEYKNWLQESGEAFPQDVKVLIKDTQEQKIELEYYKFEFEESAVPYRVPDDYVQKEF